VGLALLGDAGERVPALRHALAGRASLVVIDGVDTLDAAERDQAAALLRDATQSLLDDARLTLVLTARTESAALALLADAHRPDVAAIALRAGSTQTTRSAEVNA